MNARGKSKDGLRGTPPGAYGEENGPCKPIVHPCSIVFDLDPRIVPSSQQFTKTWDPWRRVLVIWQSWFALLRNNHCTLLRANDRKTKGRQTCAPLGPNPPPIRY
eukprot:scaffold1052_cov339-Pavlova_lutheri.AAC.23